MKIERINENQIRCTLTSFDLNARNINIIELAYGTEKARNLFREMIQRASSEVGFEAEDIPLMVEAIPLSSESIMLVITKIEDPEELDTRFARFSPSAPEEANPALSGLPDEFLEGAGDIGRLMAGHMSDAPDHGPTSEETESGSDKPVGKPIRIFLFDSLDRTAEAAKVAADICTAANALYKKPHTRQYYLVLNRGAADDRDFSRVCNILAEYGSKFSGDHASEAYFKEHYEVVIGENALKKLQLI